MGSVPSGQQLVCSAGRCPVSCHVWKPALQCAAGFLARNALGNHSLVAPLAQRTGEGARARARAQQRGPSHGGWLWGCCELFSFNQLL